MVQLWLRLFVALSELTSQTFFCWLKHSGGSCSAAAREVAAVARGWCQQGTGVAARSCGGHSSRDELRAMAKAAGVASEVEQQVANGARTAGSVAGISGF